MAEEKLRVIKLDDRSLEVELKGEDHAVANLIAKLALRRDCVRYAAYRIEHPLVSDPVLYIVTDGSCKPLDVLEDVLKEVLEYARRLRGELEQALPAE